MADIDEGTLLDSGEEVQEDVSTPEDQGGDEPQPEASPAEEGQPAEEAKDKPYLVVHAEDGREVRSYKTPEDAEKGIRELESYLSRKDRELNELRTQQRLEALEAQRQHAEVEAQRKADEEALEKLREEASDNPGKLVDLLIEQQRYIEQRIAQERSEFTRQQLKQSDDYRAHQAVVDQMVDAGLPLEKAVEIAKGIAPAAPAKPRQPATPAPAPSAPPRVPTQTPQARRLSGVARNALESMGLGHMAGGIEKRLTGEN